MDIVDALPADVLPDSSNWFGLGAFALLVGYYALRDLVQSRRAPRNREQANIPLSSGDREVLMTIVNTVRTLHQHVVEDGETVRRILLEVEVLKTILQRRR